MFTVFYSAWPNLVDKVTIGERVTVAEASELAWSYLRGCAPYTLVGIVDGNGEPVRKW
jgi:hypothetical protein